MVIDALSTIAKKAFTLLRKQKKFILFALLCCVVMGVFIPNITSAAFINHGCWLGLIGCIVGNSAPDIGEAVVKNTLNAIVIAIGWMAIIVSGALSALSHALLTGIMSIPPTIGGVSISYSYTQLTGPNANPLIAAGWPIARNFANMFIVLGLIAIAVATILRFKNFETKQLLAKLIIAALFVNFSLVICGIFIDISNVTMHSFINDGRADTFGGYFTRATTALSETAAASFGREAQNSIMIFGTVVSIVIYNITVFLILLLFFFLFAFRYIALWILVILSPLAFVSAIFPQTERFFSMWRTNFIQWCIIGIPGAFSLYLANKLTERIGNGANPMAYFLPAMLLVGGFLFSLQTSAIGSGMAISAFQGTSRFLRDKVGGGVADKVGATRLKNWAQDKATTLGEKVGLVQAGTTSINQKSRLAAAKQRIAAFADDPKKLAEIASQDLGTASEKKREEIAAAAAMLAEQKKFDKIDAGKRDKVLSHMVTYGGKKSTVTDQHPELDKVTDEEARKSLLQKELAKKEDELMASGMDQKEAREKAEEHVYGERRMVKGWKPDYKNVKATYSASKLEIEAEKERLQQEKIKEKVQGYTPITNKEAIEKLENDHIENILSANVVGSGLTQREYLERDMKLAGLNTDEIKVEMKKKTEKIRNDYRKDGPPLTSEIVKAKEELLQERGTPEAAAKNKAEILKLVATEGITEEQASARLLKNAHAASKINTTDATDEEVLKMAEEQTSKGAKFLKEAITRGILHMVAESDPTKRDGIVKNATRLGDRVEALAKEDYHYEEYNDKAVNKILIKQEENRIGRKMSETEKTTYTQSISATNPTRTTAKAAAVKARLKENLPRMSNDQLKNISPVDHLTPDIVGEFSIKQIQAFEGEPEIIAHLQDLVTDKSGMTPPVRNLFTEYQEAARGGSSENDTEYKRLGKIIKTIKGLT